MQLVVIAIIAILVSLLFPALGRAKERGRTTKCISNVRQIMLAMKLYIDDYGRSPAVFRSDPSGYGKNWQDDLCPYLSLKSPYEPIQMRLTRTLTVDASTYASVLRCPSYKELGSRYQNGWMTWVPWSIYGYNSQTPYALSRSATEAIDYDSNYTKESSIVRPSEMIAVGDADMLAYDNPKMVLGDSDFHYIPLKYRQTQPGFTRQQQAVKLRHNGSHVIGFCDG